MTTETSILEGELQARLQPIVERYRGKRGAVIPVLQEIRECSVTYPESTNFCRYRALHPWRDS